MDDEAWNQWLLYDRLSAIRDVIIAHQRPVNIQTTDNPTRDYVLQDMLQKSGALSIKSVINDPIIVSSIEAQPHEQQNPSCVEFNKKHAVIKFYPLKICNQAWIEWYLTQFPARKE